MPRETVYIIVRHIKGRDMDCGVERDKKTAQARAERIAEIAARDYGYGSTSVYKGTLTYTKKALIG